MPAIGSGSGFYGLLHTRAAVRHALQLAVLLLLTTHAGCGEAASSNPRAPASPSRILVVDDARRELRLPRPARRVVSLVPAATETLFALGAADVVVGRTRYDRDAAVGHLPSVGGGLDPSLEAILAVNPDLVIAFETAGGSKIRARLEGLGIPVFGIRTQDTADVLRNVRKLGTLVGREAAADSLIEGIRAGLADVPRLEQDASRPSVAYVASVDPPIIAGRGTYISELIGVAGGEPIGVRGAAGLWPQVSLEELVRLQPDVVILPVGEDPAASEERLRREPGWRDLRAVREGRIAVVPADLMNRPGPRIAEVARVLQQAIDDRWPPR